MRESKNNFVGQAASSPRTVASWQLALRLYRRQRLKGAIKRLPPSPSPPTRRADLGNGETKILRTQSSFTRGDKSFLNQLPVRSTSGTTHIIRVRYMVRSRATAVAIQPSLVGFPTFLEGFQNVASAEVVGTELQKFFGTGLVPELLRSVHPDSFPDFSCGHSPFTATMRDGSTVRARWRMSSTSTSLLERLQKQPDEAAWRRLVEVYTPLIRHSLRVAGIQADDVDDLVQEVLGAVVRDLPVFQHNGRAGPFRAWLRGITVNRMQEFCAPGNDNRKPPATVRRPSTNSKRPAARCSDSGTRNTTATWCGDCSS